MLFQLKMVLKKEDIYALATAVTWGGAWSKGIMRFQKICMMIVGTMLMLSGGFGLISTIHLLLVGNHNNDSPAYVFPVLLGISVFFCFLGLLLVRVRNSSFVGRASWKNYKLKDAALTYEFYEDYFTEHTPNSDYRANYTLIQYVAEDEGHFFLFTGKRSAFVLCKDDFLVGDSEEFGPWITGKVGKPIKKIY